MRRTLKDHPYLTDAMKNSEYNRFLCNNMFHMMDLFDKKRMVTEFKLEKNMDCMGRLEKYSSYYKYADTKNKKRVIKESKKYIYKITLEKENVDKEIGNYIEKKDKDYLASYLEITTMLHEFAHLKSFAHKKRFRRIYQNMVYKWIGHISGTTSKNVKNEMGGIFECCYNRAYYKKERRRNDLSKM